MQQILSEDVLTKIGRLYLVYGAECYEEACTKLQHSEQSGMLALQSNFGDEFSLAAFLHDIGHLLAEEDQLSGKNDYGYAAHDQLGADFLKQCGFSDKIVCLVREHVQVKRYLVATQPGYLKSLSHASTVTLGQQGGPMSTAEVEAYAKHPYINEIIALRNIDDSGKLPERECEPMSFWLNLMKKHLNG